MLLLHAFLTLAWLSITGVFTSANLLLGWVLCYVVLQIVVGRGEHSAYFWKTRRLFWFAFFFAWELLSATLRVALDILRPRQRIRPAIIELNVEGKSAAEIAMLANVITLTPGSMALDVSHDQGKLYVHSMYAKDVEAARRQLEQGFGRRIGELFQ